jgi:hypothetical protein
MSARIYVPEDRNDASVPLLSRPLSGDNRNHALEQLETLRVTFPGRKLRVLKPRLLVN